MTNAKTVEKAYKKYELLRPLPFENAGNILFFDDLGDGFWRFRLTRPGNDKIWIEIFEDALQDMIDDGWIKEIS